MIKDFFESIPWWIKYPVFFLMLFAGSVFWFEDRNDGKIQAALNPVIKEFDAKIQKVEGVHSADINGIKGELSAIYNQNSRIIQQNDRMIMHIIDLKNK